ncbi:hypothetical protein GOP47_0024132 [Adiantum capillus-veneris]|uniref:Rho termination factor N-terminal domain-containing protein n=1 Tax=Adiantum capillus-veneris TaxID=13818 RepID=A0A9D4Z5U5_ADICA|nr:hypothetical protein GOP47_0024132 [Adiantum capillus-veneris]
MATTACACAGSSTLSPMKQLHALHPLACRSPPSLTLPNPCKLAFLFYLPTRLNPFTSTTHRLSLSPPFCGHGELEIISVKELADGFLHFSFGAPASASKANDLSSSCGEHLSQKWSVPGRLPSKFLKKSPIPSAADKRRRRQGESSSKTGTEEAIPPNIKEAVKFSSRPKSSFVKRSPVPKPHIGGDTLARERVSNGTAAVHDKSMMAHGTKVGPSISRKSLRPSSVFVRKSPIPPSAGKLNDRHAMLSANSDRSPSKCGYVVPLVQKRANTSPASRPKSNFVRRSPTGKVPQFSPRASSMIEQSLLSHEESTATDTFVKSQNTPEESPHVTVDLEKCKLPELKNLAKIRGVKGYYKLKKAELLDILKKLDS